MAPPAKPTPLGVSCCSQMVVVRPMALPSFFQTSHRVPSEAMKGLGSMAPPRLVGQISGAPPDAVYGPPARR